MKRPYILMATALLVLGLLFDWRLSRAHDHDQPASALEPVHRDQTSNVIELSERIEALEKRLAAVEGRQPLIRQADNRETTGEYLTGPALTEEIPANHGQDVNDKNSSQVTNGRKWRFRLLSNQNRE